MGTHHNPRRVGEQNPRDNFCRRHGHQTTVIDDKLYIDGGYVNFDTFPTDNQTYPSKWDLIRPIKDQVILRQI